MGLNLNRGGDFHRWGSNQDSKEGRCQNLLSFVFVDSIRAEDTVSEGFCCKAIAAPCIRLWTASTNQALAGLPTALCTALHVSPLASPGSRGLPPIIKGHSPSPYSWLCGLCSARKPARGSWGRPVLRIDTLFSTAFAQADR